jgi:oxygen-dependent protoporphyrinogen oxidase
VLGVLADSIVFPDRAPNGHMLLRVMIGGAIDPAHERLTDNELVERAVGVARDVLGLRGDPSGVWTYRHSRAIPQYTLGHAASVADLRARLARVLPRVRVFGNAYDGVSVGSIIEAAERCPGTPPAAS